MTAPGDTRTAHAAAIEVALTLNGAPVRVTARAGESLLDLLRDRLGITSPKRGCAPLGQCGACVAVVDGEPRATCTIPAEAAAGRDVLTLEGLDAVERAVWAGAFATGDALQCGFCTPGIVLRAHHLLASNPAPTRAEIMGALDEHLCRCTGWVRVVEAIERAAEKLRPGPAPLPEPQPRTRREGVGAALERHEARALALGTRPFVDDMTRPGMMYGAVVLAEHARARVKRIDVSAARAMPGVTAVVTAADVPGERWYGLIHGDWPGFVAEGEETRCVGDVLAAVAADHEALARAAAAAVVVDYEPLEPVTDPGAALRDGAPRVHPRFDNLLSRSVIRRGDADAALAASAHVVTDTWRTQRIEHFFLEPECALAEPHGDGGIRLFSQGQGIFDDRRHVAAFLGLETERVHVTLVPGGGAFGGKEDLSIQAHAALLAWKTGRPVKLALSRRESIRMHPKRHPITITLSAGCDEAGRLTAVKARFIGDTGAYASVGMKVLERAAGHACGPYRVPHVDVESLAVRTNNPPCGAMRGFGVPQAAFAIEGALDRLAEAAGIDAWEIRWLNAVGPGDVLTTGQPIEKSVGIRATLEAVKPHWDKARRDGVAVGIACGLKNSGLGNGAVEWGRARIVVNGDGTATLFHGYTEMGQGLNTVMIQVAAEVTGLPAALFRPCVDTTHPLDCGQTTGSRATLLGGRAMRGAAEKLRDAMGGARDLKPLAGRTFACDVRVDDTTPLGAAVERPKTHTSYGFATQLVTLDADGRVARVVAAHDVGRAINPAMCEGQIQGAVHMGLGYALTEELPCVDGMPVTFSRYQIGILRARDMPEVEVIVIEEPEPEGPFGAKGLGEIGLVPTAAAVAGALHAYDGVRRTRLPMKDAPAAKAMSVGRIRTPHPRERWR